MEKLRRFKNFSRNLLIVSMTIQIIFLSGSCFANDLGVLGNTFPIKEMDFLRVLQGRVIQLTRLGYMQKLQKALQTQAIALADRPSPVEGISTTMAGSTWNYDPSITMPQDIRSPDGRLIVKAGARYNPLEDTHLEETLLFYDADDAKQVAWAQRLDHQLKGKDKLILVNGSVESQEKRFKKPVYFDQFGQLTSRFQIHTVPATVGQSGLRLKVSEVLP